MTKIEITAEDKASTDALLDKLQWACPESERAVIEAHIASVRIAAEQKPDFESSYQNQVKNWTHECFGQEAATEKTERCDRFIEEALELLQALNYYPGRVYALIDYVYGRDKGEPSQEVGGVMISLSALCTAVGIVLNDAARKEIERVWTKVEAIRIKQASKPRGDPLPVPNAYSIDKVTAADREAAWQTRPECYGENTKAHWDRGVYDNTKHIQSYKNHRMSRFKKG